MIDITAWMEDFLQALNETFANRVWFVGLQGSYGRGEAGDKSDIDVVVILNDHNILMTEFIGHRFHLATVHQIGICQYYNCLISLAITVTSFAFVSIIMVSNV